MRKRGNSKDQGDHEKQDMAQQVGSQPANRVKRMIIDVKTFQTFFSPSKRWKIFAYKAGFAWF